MSSAARYIGVMVLVPPVLVAHPHHQRLLMDLLTLLVALVGGLLYHWMTPFGHSHEINLPLPGDDQKITRLLTLSFDHHHLRIL